MDRTPPLSSDIALPEGYRLEAFEVLGSTNDEAFVRARAGDPGGLWIVAAEQSQGRGRHGRAWTSRPGNFYGSLLLRAPCAAAVSPQLGFVAGVALHEAVQAITGLGRDRLALKWPNDLLLDGAKLAGILVEGSTLIETGELAIVIGFGVNLAHHPADTPYRATNCAEAGFGITPMQLLAALSRSAAAALARWNRGQGFPGIRQEWLSRAGGVGEMIIVRRPEGDRRGLFRDLDAHGRLLLDSDGVLLAIQAGDVFLPGLARSVHAPASEQMNAEQGTAPPQVASCSPSPLDTHQRPDDDRGEQRTN